MRDFPGAGLIRKLRGDTPHPGPSPSGRNPLWLEARSSWYDRGNTHEGFVFEVGGHLVKVCMVSSYKSDGEFHLKVFTREK